MKKIVIALLLISKPLFEVNWNYIKKIVELRRVSRIEQFLELTRQTPNRLPVPSNRLPVVSNCPDQQPGLLPTYNQVIKQLNNPKKNSLDR